MGQMIVNQILDLMDSQRERLFSDLDNISESNLWLRASPGEWSIGENLDHLRVIYASTLPILKIAWNVFYPLARLRSGNPYLDEIDNVYHRPGFPQKVGWLWPPRYTPTNRVSREILYDGLRAVHARTRAFYFGKAPDVLGHVPLWDPAIGRLNLTQALRVGVYHDEVHIESIREQMNNL
jgi:hypothetical protein